MKVEEEDMKSIVVFAFLRSRKKMWLIPLCLSESNLMFIKLLREHYHVSEDFILN